MCFNTFNGNYDGPVNVDKVLPWAVEYKPISGNRYQITSTRQFEAEGTVVEAQWKGFLIIEETKLPSCAVKFIQEKFQWVNPTKDGKAHYQERLRLQTALL